MKEISNVTQQNLKTVKLNVYVVQLLIFMITYIILLYSLESLNATSDIIMCNKPHFTLFWLYVSPAQSPDSFRSRILLYKSCHFNNIVRRYLWVLREFLLKDL